MTTTDVDAMGLLLCLKEQQRSHQEYLEALLHELPHRVAAAVCSAWDVSLQQRHHQHNLFPMNTQKVPPRCFHESETESCTHYKNSSYSSVCFDVAVTGESVDKASDSTRGCTNERDKTHGVYFSSESPDLTGLTKPTQHETNSSNPWFGAVWPSSVSVSSFKSMKLASRRFSVDMKKKDLREAESVLQVKSTPRRPSLFTVVTKIPRRTQFIKCVNSKMFEMLTIFVILANSILIGYEEDHSLRNLSTDIPSWLIVCNLASTIYFLLELILRIIAEGKHFFRRFNKNLMWNILDTVAVAGSLLELAFESVTSEVPDTKAIRMLRLMRLARAFRIIRIFRFCRPLRCMVVGIQHSLWPLLWIMLLLVVFMFVLAVVVLPIVRDELKDLEEDPGPDSRDKAAQLRKYYGSMYTFLYFLYQATTSGLNYGMFIEPMRRLIPGLDLLLLLYMSFATLCVLNTVTGIFVENAIAVCAQDEANAIAHDIDNQKRWYADVERLFRVAVDGRPGRKLTESDFIALVQDPCIQALFRKVGIDVEPENASGVFAMIDFDGEKALGLEEFAYGLRTFHGTARSLDLARQRIEGKRMQSKLQRLAKLCETHFEENHAALSQIWTILYEARKPALPDNLRRTTSIETEPGRDTLCANNNRTSI